jgi:glutamine amidotransferase-like uncharacterized protein
MDTNRILVTAVVTASTVLTACGARGQPRDSAAILLFNGSGASQGSVAALEAVLTTSRLDYATVDSAQLNGLDEPALRRHRLLIVPGGNFVDMGSGLAKTTAVSIRNAVRNGLNYLGVCGGGFLAGNSPYNGLNLTSGVRFGFYSAEGKGIRKAAVAITAAEGPTLEHYWEDGPQFTGWGEVIGKYPDGTPAIVQRAVGNGWVVLTGVHPEAPEKWRQGMAFTTPASADNAYAEMLIRAALERKPLPYY